MAIYRVVGQPNVNLKIDRAKVDRFGINVADVQDAVETAVGGKAVSQILEGERRYDLVVRYQPEYRGSIERISDIRLLSPSGERVALGQLASIQVEDGASVIYRDSNSRYVAIKYSVRGRDLGSTVEQAMHDVGHDVKLPTGYHLDWAGEYESQKRAQRRLSVIVPLTILIIYLVLYSAFGSFKWAGLVLLNVAMAPVGGVAALLVTGTHFSVSSGVGFLALFGVSVQIGLIMVEYINQLRARGMDGRRGGDRRRGATLAAHHDDHAGGHARAAAGGAIPRHRLGLPAAVRHRDCRRPWWVYCSFAYCCCRPSTLWFARENDKLAE